MKNQQSSLSERDKVIKKILAGKQIKLDNIEDEYTKVIVKRLIKADDRHMVCLICGGVLWEINNQLKCGDCLRCFDLKQEVIK